MGGDFILLERLDSVGVMTPNRPEKLDALSRRLGHELDEVLTRLENDACLLQRRKRLLHKDIGLGWREGYDNEDQAYATCFTSAHPHESFQDFLSRKGWRA